jgi:hypothetical protein
MAYDIEDAMADAEKEAQKEKKMAYYVGFLIMGKIILIMIIWLCYVFFIQRHVARSIEENMQDSYLVTSQPTSNV